MNFKILGTSKELEGFLENFKDVYGILDSDQTVIILNLRRSYMILDDLRQF